jgi:hypothetical protein
MGRGREGLEETCASFIEQCITLQNVTLTMHMEPCMSHSNKGVTPNIHICFIDAWTCIFVRSYVPNIFYDNCSNTPLSKNCTHLKAAI